MDSLVSFTRQREEKASAFTTRYQRRCHATSDIITRLGLETELQGHQGCVNCLEWSKDGRLLASGSDDCHAIIWNPLEHRKLTSVRTCHTGNIFSVKFMPESSERLLATCAADFKVTLIDMEEANTLHIFSNHKSRVKRLATAADEPHLLFSAAEDGTVMQFDLREPEAYAEQGAKSVLVNLNHYTQQHAEAKCLCVSPTRTELIAVGCGDPYVRMYDRRMIRCSSAPKSVLEKPESSEYDVPANCVQYFIPGHIPARANEYSRKMRMLAATHVTFSPDGRDLLVNLGGEQIYLYNIYDKKMSYQLDTRGVSSEGGHSGGCGEQHGANGYHKSQPKNAHTDSRNHRLLNLSDIQIDTEAEMSQTLTLPARIEEIKQEANHEFQRQNHCESISLYNKAISLCPTAAVLYSNRAAALLKRNWDGDTYAALHDCIRAIKLNMRQYKAYYRLARCLLKLNRVEEALACQRNFQRLFPDQASGHSFDALCFDIEQALIKQRTEPDYSATDKSSDSDTDSDDESATTPAASLASSASRQEKTWRSAAADYDQRYCGHCNTTTDIKEANFIGDNGQYIVAGSDDGSFFIWDRETANIVRTLRGDDCIVNCVQPHPSTCVLATSGIDKVVRLWSPQPEGVKQERCVDNSYAAASANQRRMNADPLEAMLMNMGYRVNRGGGDQEPGEDNEEGPGGDMQCRPF